jgi:hypothetical protein
VAGEGKASSAVSINEYKYTVNIGDQHIRITGIKQNLLQCTTAKIYTHLLTLEVQGDSTQNVLHEVRCQK